MCSWSSSVSSSTRLRFSSTIRRPDACPVDSASGSPCCAVSPTRADSSVSSHRSSSRGDMLTTSRNSLRIATRSSSENPVMIPAPSAAPTARTPTRAPDRRRRRCLRGERCRPWTTGTRQHRSSNRPTGDDGGGSAGPTFREESSDMGYVLERDESVEDGVRRIAREQLDDAVDDLENLIDDDPADAVHDVRKRCKKVRGLVRLVRPSLGEDTYRVANDTARDAGRHLSDLRDATALMETFELVVDRSEMDRDADDEAGTAVRAVGDVLRSRHRRAVDQLDHDHPAVRRARDLVVGCRSASVSWTLDDDGWDAIGPGVAKTYKRGRSAFETASEAPTSANFHELRKRVKYSWYHVRLVADASPTVLSPLASAFHDLSDALGDAHDMAVLHDVLRTEEADLVDLPDLTPIDRLLGGFRSVLEQRALSLGARLYTEPRSAYVERLGGYWQAWLDHGDERPTGGIDEIRDDD